MTVESAVYIDTLNAAYPPGTDAKKEGDDHLRLIKAVLKSSFPNVNGALGFLIDGASVNFPTSFRIKGDFSNATQSNRALFQTSTLNSASYIAAIPNGTGPGSAFNAFSSSDPNNSAYASLACTASSMLIEAGKLGTGTYQPLSFYTGGVERFNIGAGSGITAKTNFTVDTNAGNTVLSYGLFLKAGTYTPQLRAASNVPGIEVVNGANTVVNYTLYDSGIFRANLGEVQASAQLRAFSTNAAAMLRADDTNGYLLSTAIGDRFGGFNTVRPFYWAHSTGAVFIASNGANVSFGAYGIGQILTSYITGVGQHIIRSNQAQSYLCFQTANNFQGNFLYDQTGPNFALVNQANSAYVSLVASAFTVGSDEAFKTNITPFNSVLDLLKNKRTVRFNRKLPMSDGGGEGRTELGVIAQEWQDDFPELISEGVDIDSDGDFIAHQFDKEGNEIFGPHGPPASRKSLYFNYPNAVTVALQGVMELQAALDKALQRIATLEGATP